MRRGRLRNDVYIDFISDICAASSAQAKLGVYRCGTCFSSCYAAFSPNQRPKISGSAKALSGCIAVY